MRRFLRGDEGMVPALMLRLYGSDDLFPDDRMHAYHPFQSVNYVTCHDGFTLYDLVAYQEKRNWANGDGNRDGPAENCSWNCGWEGDDDVPAEVVAIRKRQARNFCCLLFLQTARRCCARATSSCKRNAATTIHTTRTTKRAGSTGIAHELTPMSFASSR